MKSIPLFFRSVIKSFLLISSFVICFQAAHAQDLVEGAALFQSKCKSCHQIDRKTVGPALKGVDTRYDEAWLIKWVKNAPLMIGQKDPAAVKLYEEYKPNMMSPFPSLSDESIKNIFAYVKSEEGKVAAPAAAATVATGGAEAGTGSSGTGVSDFMLLGLIVVIVIAFLIIGVLNRIINTLERLLAKRSGVVSGKDHDLHS